MFFLLSKKYSEINTGQSDSLNKMQMQSLRMVLLEVTLFRVNKFVKFDEKLHTK